MVETFLKMGKLSAIATVRDIFRIAVGQPCGLKQAKHFVELLQSTEGCEDQELRKAVREAFISELARDAKTAVAERADDEPVVVTGRVGGRSALWVEIPRDRGFYEGEQVRATLEKL